MICAAPAAGSVAQHDSVGTECCSFLLELGNRIGLENAEQWRSVTGEKSKGRKLRCRHLGLHDTFDSAALERGISDANIRLGRVRNNNGHDSHNDGRRLGPMFLK